MLMRYAAHAAATMLLMRGYITLSAFVLRRFTLHYAAMRCYATRMATAITICRHAYDFRFRLPVDIAAA